MQRKKKTLKMYTKQEADDKIEERETDRQTIEKEEDDKTVQKDADDKDVQREADKLKIATRMARHFKAFYKPSFKIDPTFLYRNLGFMIEFFRYIQNLDTIIRHIFMKTS